MRSVLLILAISAISAFMPLPASAAPQWTPVGPAGPQIGSGKLNAFAYLESNPNVMYTGGGWGNTPRESPSQSGIYRTTDGGSHWMTANNGLTNTDGTISSVVNGLWLDQGNPSIVLAATEFGGTFRSVNSGNTWTNVDRSEATQFAQSGSTVYLATGKGILVSTNNGASWTVSLSTSPGASTVVSAAGATYAGTMSGDVYRLNGSAWTKTGHPGTGPVHDLAVDPYNVNIVYANVDDKAAWNENLYGSIDGGVTWKRIFCPCSIGAQAIAFSLVIPHRIYLGDDGSGVIFHFTADGNQHPQLIAGAEPYGVDMRYIIPAVGKDGTDDACYLLMDQGLFYGPRCSSGFAPGLNVNVPDTLAYDVKVTSNASTAIVALQDNSAALSLDGGTTWNYPGAANAGEGGESFIDPYNSAHCYFAHPDSGLWVSSNACATFSGPVTAGIESLAFDPTHAGKLYSITNADTAAAQVVVSTNYGTSWTPTSWHFSNPYQVEVSPADANTIVVATGTAASVPKLFYTHDGGTTWLRASGLPQHVAPNFTTLYFPVHRFYAAFEPNLAGAVLLADHDPSTDNVFIYRSTDNAQSFARVRIFEQPVPTRPWPHLLYPRSNERPAPEIPYYATRFFGNRLSFNPQAPTGRIPAVVLTTRFGAYISFSHGVKWRRIDTTAIAHHFIGAAWNNGYVFLASFGQGVIRSATPLQ